MMARTSAAPNPKLGDFLCFAVYSANLAFGRAYRPILDKVGLTYTQYVTLVALAEDSEQTVGELGDKLFLESNTLTPILKKLEASGLVERRRDPDDERQVRVNITSHGRKLQRKVHEDAAELRDATGLGNDFAKVQRTVGKLRDNLLRASGDVEAKNPR
jgi:DNA-binding MarR family transcriptional regulator